MPRTELENQPSRRSGFYDLLAEGRGQHHPNLDHHQTVPWVRSKLSTPARAVQRVTPAPAELMAAWHVLGTRSTTPPHVTALCVVDASKTGFIFTVASGVAELD
mgnify:CR=1 FL=1